MNKTLYSIFSFFIYFAKQLLLTKRNHKNPNGTTVQIWAKSHIKISNNITIGNDCVFFIDNDMKNQAHFSDGVIICTKSFIFGDNLKLAKKVIVFKQTITGVNFTVLANSMITKLIAGDNVSIGNYSLVSAGSNFRNNINIGNKFVGLKSIQLNNYTEIGDNTTIFENFVAGEESEIGDNCKIEQGVALGNSSFVGNNCTIANYSIIGSFVEILATCYISENSKIDDHSIISPETANTTGRNI